MAGKTGNDPAARALSVAVKGRHVARLLRSSAVYKGHFRVINVFRNVLFGTLPLLVAACTELSGEVAL